MVDKMKNIKDIEDNIKEKVLSYYRDIKDRQIELENRYYNYVKNRSHNQIKKVDLIVAFFLGMILICIINLFFENVWKASDEWTKLENISLLYIYFRVGYHTSDYMTEYLFDIRSKKKREEKMNKPGATKENPIDLTKDEKKEKLDASESKDKLKEEIIKEEIIKEEIIKEEIIKEQENESEEEVVVNKLNIEQENESEEEVVVNKLNTEEEVMEEIEI